MSGPGPHDRADSATLLARARLLASGESTSAALEACEEAIAVWPDIAEAYRLRLHLARAAGDRARIVDALETLLRHDAEDTESCAALGAMLLEDGAFERAASVLRPVAARLGDRGDAMACFTTALAHLGSWEELRAFGPLIERLAADRTGSHPAQANLALAHLAGAADAPRVLAEAAALEASPRWIDATEALARVTDAIAASRPFAMLRLDASLAAFAALCGRNADRLLRPGERTALLDTVWPVWFGTSSSEAAAILPALRQGFSDAIDQADLVALPGAAELGGDPARFGALTEMHRLARFGTDAAFAGLGLAEAMHRQVPYLRTALAGLPFLGFVGAHPAMFRKLAHFCGVSETRFVPLPREASHPVAEDGIDPRRFLQDGFEATIDGLAVPFRGAVFLLSAPGPLGAAIACRIKAQGGIALDIGPLAARWAGG